MGYHAIKPDSPTDYFVPLIVNGIDITDRKGTCRPMFNYGAAANGAAAIQPDNQNRSDS